MEENKPKPEQNSNPPIVTEETSLSLSDGNIPAQALSQIMNSVNELKSLMEVSAGVGGAIKLNNASIGGDVRGNLYETSIVIGADKSNPIGKYTPINPERHLCNIIVSHAFDPEINIFTIDKCLCLTQKEFTERVFFRRFHQMQAKEIEVIRTFPTLFMREVVKENGILVPNQDAYVGYVMKVQEERYNYRIQYSRSGSPMPVTQLYGFLEKLKIDKKPYHGELMDEHWAIKGIDLFAVLEEMGYHYSDLYNVR